MAWVGGEAVPPSQVNSPKSSLATTLDFYNVEWYIYIINASASAVRPAEVFVIIFSMSVCILFIDGENFLHKVEDVLKEEGIDKNKVDLSLIDLNKLFRVPLKGFKLSRKIFYAARYSL